MSVELVDTNIFVYAYDPTETARHERARGLVGELWQEGTGCLSTQVLLELFVVLTRKLPNRMAPQKARDLVEDLARWPVHSPSAQDVVAAIRLSVKDRLSAWDANLVQSAIAMGASVLWTEHLQHGRRFGSVTVKNPFWSGASERR